MQLRAKLPQAPTCKSMLCGISNVRWTLNRKRDCLDVVNFPGVATNMTAHLQVFYCYYCRLHCELGSNWHRNFNQFFDNFTCVNFIAANRISEYQFQCSMSLTCHENLCLIQGGSWLHLKCRWIVNQHFQFNWLSYRKVTDWWSFPK